MSDTCDIVFPENICRVVPNIPVTFLAMESDIIVTFLNSANRYVQFVLIFKFLKKISSNIITKAL